jgi:hypothetical protein
MEEITRENCGTILNAFIGSEGLTVRKVAKAIGCPEGSIYRIALDHTLPSDEMLKQIGIMLTIGFKHYAELSKAQKEKISEAIGAVGGGAIGFAGIGAAIMGLGGGAAGGAAIAAGLAALGKIIGGGMLAGVGVAAAIPIAVGAAGYGVVKGVKHVIGNHKLGAEGIDLYWEMPLE